MFHTQVMFSCLIMIFRVVYSVVFLGVRMIKSLIYVCFLSHCRLMHLLFVFLSCPLSSYSPLLEMGAVVRGPFYGSQFLPPKKAGLYTPWMWQINNTYMQNLCLRICHIKTIRTGDPEYDPEYVITSKLQTNQRIEAALDQQLPCSVK